MICNHFHNILRLFDVSANVPFTTSETMRDYSFLNIVYFKHSIYELPNNLKLNNLEIKQIRNIRKVSKPHRMIAPCPAPPPSKMKILPILSKNSSKTEIKLSCSALLHTKTRASLKYCGQDGGR